MKSGRYGKTTIIVKTWPNGTDKLFALRNYEVKYPDGRHIASGTSSWLILDRTTKKVQRPDSILTQYNPDLHTENSPVRYASKIEPAAESGQISPIIQNKSQRSGCEPSYKQCQISEMGERQL